MHQQVLLQINILTLLFTYKIALLLVICIENIQQNAIQMIRDLEWLLYERSRSDKTSNYNNQYFRKRLLTSMNYFAVKEHRNN